MNYIIDINFVINCNYKIMNILILGINGEIGESLFRSVYNKNDFFILTYNKKKPSIKYNNILLKKINFNIVKNSNSEIKNLLKKFKTIDVVINNIGDSNPFKDVFALKINELNKSLRINFSSIYFSILSIIKSQIKKGFSLKIIHISTNTIKYYGSNKNLPYLISKSALETALLNLSKLFSKNRIKINIIRPGLINNKKSTRVKGYSNKLFKNREKLVPIKEAGKPEDIANLVKFLISKNSQYIYGQIISVSGGE